MTKRFGGGEFERANVEPKQSDIEARYFFLKALYENRSKWAVSLLGLCKYDEIPKELLNPDKVDFTINLFLAYLTNRQTHKIEIPPQLLDTPLINYYRFFSDKAKKIEEIEKDENAQKLGGYSGAVKRKNYALKQIISKWKDLKKMKSTNAVALCSSLEKWAKNYNLNADWFLDFGISVLHKFKSEFDFKLNSFNWENITLGEYLSRRIYYELEVKDSISQSISDFATNEIYFNDFEGFDDIGSIPEFDYRCGDFELPSSIWLPRIETRKNFAAEMEEKLKETIGIITRSNQLYNYSNKDAFDQLVGNLSKEIENYCNKIEPQHKQFIDEFAIPPLDSRFLEVEIFGLFTWYPSQIPKDEFIEYVLEVFRRKVEKNYRAYQSYNNNFTKKHFKSELKKYCDKIETLLPPEWEKTPLKYSDEKHFKWLVEYQIPPCKTYTQIAEEYEVNIKSVTEVVQKLADVIGIQLRPAKHTGRPAGTKNSPTSRRQIGSFKK